METRIKPIQKKLKKFSRRIDRNFDAALELLAEKCGGYVNLLIIAVISIMTILCAFMAFWGSGNGRGTSIIILFIIFLAAKVFTQDKIRVRTPWWYRKKR